MPYHGLNPACQKKNYSVASYVTRSCVHTAKMSCGNIAILRKFYFIFCSLNQACQTKNCNGASDVIRSCVHIAVIPLRASVTHTSMISGQTCTKAGALLSSRVEVTHRYHIQNQKDSFRDNCFKTKKKSK